VLPFITCLLTLKDNYYANYLTNAWISSFDPCTSWGQIFRLIFRSWKVDLYTGKFCITWASVGKPDSWNASVLVTKRGVMVLGVPCVDHWNWGRETRHCLLFMTECSVLRRKFWQESYLMRSSHIQRCQSFSERVGPRIIFLESQPSKQGSHSNHSREITINWADCSLSSIYENAGKKCAVNDGMWLLLLLFRTLQ